MSSTKSLRIAYLVTGDGRSGTYFRYHNFAKGLVRSGHRVVVYGQSASERWSARREERDGVEYVLAPSMRGNGWIDFAINPGNLCWRAAQKIERADVYHLFQPFENSALPWLALRKLRSTEKALFAWDWDDLWCGGLMGEEPAHGRRKWRYRLLNHFEHSLPDRAALVTTCSGYLARLAQNRGAAKAEVIHNGYWTERPTAERASLRESFGLKADAFYLGFIGWTPSEVTWCLEVLSQLDSNVRLASCGYDLRKNLAAYPDLASRVDYLGEITSERARQLMSAIDVGLLPLAQTPFNESRLPIKFAEYLAAGIPAICGDVGEVGSLGRMIPGAILFPPEKEPWIAGCVSAIRKIQQDPATHRPNVTALEKHLSWPNLVDQLENAYCAGLERSASGTRAFAESRRNSATQPALEAR